MARQEVDRENLLREATALVERVELVIPGFDDAIVCGFRRDSSASFFFGADPVYQFNTACQLRRAFIGGRIVKAERSRLIALSRQRSLHEVVLVRHELSDEGAQSLLLDMRASLERLQESLETGSFTISGQVASGSNVVGRVLKWLKAMPAKIEIASVPNASKLKKRASPDFEKP